MDETDKALGAVISFLLSLYQDKRVLRTLINSSDDEGEIGELECEMKLLRSEESSLHRIESGLQ